MILTDEDKILRTSLYKWYTAKRLTDDFPRKAGQNMVLISCSKSCGTQAQLTGGQAMADVGIHAASLLYSVCTEVSCGSLNPATCDDKNVHVFVSERG